MEGTTSLALATGSDEAYGLIYTGCLGSVLSVCVSRNGHQVRVTAFRHAWNSFCQPDNVERTLTTADWLRLKKTLEEADFWALPEHHLVAGFDGWRWTIEGQDGERYHSSTLWCPVSGPFHELGSLLVEFSGLTVPEDLP